MRRAIAALVALSLLLLPTLVEPPRPEATVEPVELLVNGGFEAGTTVPWIPLEENTLQISSCQPHSGSNAGALTVTGYNYVLQTVAVAPNATYEFTGYVSSSGAAQTEWVGVRVLWFSDAEAQDMISHTQLARLEPPPMDYQPIQGDGMSPPGARSARVRIEVSVTETRSLCLDDLSFSGPPPLPTPTPTAPATSTLQSSPTPSLTPVPTATPPPTRTPTPTAVPIAMGSLLNGGFEGAAADGLPIAWQKFGGSLSRTSAFARSGTYSGAFTSESDTTKWVYQVVGVEPNQAYAFEGYVLTNGPPGSRAFLRVSWYASADGSGQLLSNADSPDDLTGGNPSFRYLSSGAVIAPANAHSAKLRFMLSPASSGGETVYLDDFAFFETAPPTATPVATPTPTPSRTSTPVPALTATTVAGGPGPTAVPIASGSLLNGSFEEAAADGLPIAWQKFGGSLSRTSAFARSGTFSGAFTSESDTTKWVYQVVGVEPNQAYAFEGHVLMNGPPGSQAFLRVSWYASGDGSGQLLSNADSPESLTGGDRSFRHLSTGVVVSPAEARSARARIVLLPASATSETIHLDDFNFSPQPAAPPRGAAPGGEAPASGPAPQTSARPKPAAGLDQVRGRRASGVIEAMESPYQVKISEVCYDTGHERDDSAHEWVELYNAGPETVTLAGWSLMDNTSRDPLPSTSLEPRAFAVVAAGPDFEADYPTYDGLLLFIGDGRIGNGLANRGDRLVLLDGEGQPVDALSYGDDVEIFQPPIPAVAPGHCLERTPAGYDTDSATDFRDSPQPSPGFASELLSATETPSATPQGGVSLVRGVSSPEKSAGQSDGPPWPWILLGGLLFLGGVGAGAAGALRMRARSGRRP